MQNAPHNNVWIIADYCRLFLIIAIIRNDSRDPPIAIIADYSNSFLIIPIIRIIPIIAKLCLPHAEIETIVCMSFY